MFKVGDEVYWVFCIKDLKFLKYRLDSYKDKFDEDRYNTLLEEFQTECLNSFIIKRYIDSVRLETGSDGNIKFIYGYERSNSLSSEYVFKTYEEAKTYAETHLKNLYEEYKVLLNEFESLPKPEKKQEIKQENILKVESEHKNSFSSRCRYITNITIIIWGIVIVSYTVWKLIT